MKLCVISMSGGLDSTTLAYKAIEDGFTILPININYGQKNAVEQYSFSLLFQTMKRQFPDQLLDPVEIDLTTVMSTTFELYQTIRDSKAVEEKTGFEYYTPSRNLLFSVIATVVGETAAIASGIDEVRIGLGVHKHVMYKNYWDITPEFVDKLNNVLSLNDNLKISMYAPYANSSKSQIVKDAIRLEVPYKQTWTCYNPVITDIPDGKEYLPCHVCEACVERENAGKLAGIEDINDYFIKVEMI